MAIPLDDLSTQRGDLQVARSWGPAKIRPKGVTALLRASQRPEAADAADPTGLQSASDEQSGADRPSKSGFSGLGPAYYPFSAYLGCTPGRPAQAESGEDASLSR